MPRKTRVVGGRQIHPRGSFNEAGARVPRKRRSNGPTATASGGCFNEAGARVPRKSHSQDQAYMGTFFCFNEAGARVPRKSLSPAELYLVSYRASMRPGHACPGKGDGGDDRYRGGAVAASMRPGHACPGKPYTIIYCIETQILREFERWPALQNGRCRNIGPCVYNFKDPNDNRCLQESIAGEVQTGTGPLESARQQVTESSMSEVVPPVAIIISRLPDVVPAKTACRCFQPPD